MATTPKMTKDKEVSKAYSVGSNVSCVTCNDEVCRGNVLAFDINFKAIVVETPEAEIDRVHILNLGNIKEIDVMPQDKPKYFGNKQKIDLGKVELRYNEAVERRQTELSKINDGVSDEIQLLFNQISSIYNETRWDGNKIVVIDDVIVNPPYSPNDCTGHSTDAVEMVKKIITRFYFETSSTKSLNDV